MHVLFVTSEVAGLFKIGGLADVSDALPKALSELGVTVTVALPFYASIDIKGCTGVGELSVDYAGDRETVELFTYPIADRASVLLFRHHRLLDYHKAPIEETFAFFSKAVATFFMENAVAGNNPIDIVHCNDWHTAVVPTLIGESNKTLHGSGTVQSGGVKTVITIHNLMYQGVVDVCVIDHLGAPRGIFHIVKKGTKERVSLLRSGLECADVITTVSPAYAKEITLQKHRDSLGDVFARRKDKVVGILNGIDTRSWDPSRDASLAQTYNASAVFEGKTMMKRVLRQATGLPGGPVPVFGFVGRIEPRQKGIDLVMKAIGQFHPDGKYQIVILGTGEKHTETELANMVKQFPLSVAFVNGFNETLARKIYAGSDMFLVPSKFEPCGLTQMIAMRYGTVPVVRKTGGLADTVDDDKTGFVFTSYSPRSLVDAMKRAIHAWETPNVWKVIVHRGMEADFSWKRSAGLYVDLYKSLLG